MPDYEYHPRRTKYRRQALEEKYGPTSGQQQSSNIPFMFSQTMPSYEPYFLDPVPLGSSFVPYLCCWDPCSPFNPYHPEALYPTGQSQSLRLDNVSDSQIWIFLHILFFIYLDTC
ncbi:hypothetical protein XENORESO_014325 [Xenotaenia resolanae]|uniref:Uncharacterized protein n=1 Tax=Xenotaenia resolanae TaxID=208358 RepID=A0ABV0WKC2_9TELE